MSRSKDWSVLNKKWVYDPRVGCLKAYIDEGHQVYEVPLDELNDSPHVLDWIMQIHEKAWITPEMFYAFVQGVDYIVGGVQQKYCSFGKGGKVPKEALERKKIGWRIFPMPPEENSELGIVITAETLGKLVADHDKVWIEESERICRELFEDKE